MEKTNSKIIIITGYYGTGKTNLAVNMSLALQGKGTVTAVDMDTVNPYFRLSDFTELLEAHGIKTVSPRYAGTNLDTPVLDLNMESIAADSDYTIIDLGGDDAGAYAAGRYRHVFEKYETTVLFVFSKYRREDLTPQETAETLRAVESACGLKCTALVDNSNLGAETDRSCIDGSKDFREELERLTGLKTEMICTPEETDIEKGFAVRRMVKLPWERNKV